MVSRISFIQSVRISAKRAFSAARALGALTVVLGLLAKTSVAATPAGSGPGVNSGISAPAGGTSGAECTCPSPPSLESAYDSSSLVFVGKVEDKHINPLKKGDYEVKFQVTRKLKGFEDLPTSNALVYTARENTPGKIGDCAFDFTVNGEYLVFASGTPAYLKTSACTRTAVLEKSLMDVQRIIRLYSAE